jgi:hypothetical protein
MPVTEASAMQVFVERTAKAVRRSRHEAEKKAAEDRAEQMASGCSQPGKLLPCSPCNLGCCST